MDISDRYISYRHYLLDYNKKQQMSKLNNFILKNILFLFFFVLLTGIKAQNIYSTTDGAIFIKAVINDSSVVARSHDLTILLDYETAEFSIKLDVSSLSTGVETMDNKLKNIDNKYILFKGKLGLNSINTEKHPPLNFAVKGYILSDDDEDKSINGDGSLIHVFGDNYSCVLNLNFKFNWKEAGLDIDMPGLKDELQVKIIQTVLVRKY